MTPPSRQSSWPYITLPIFSIPAQMKNPPITRSAASYFLSGATDQNVRTLAVQNAVIVEFDGVIAEARWTEAVGAVDKQLGLRADRVEVDRRCDQHEVRLHQMLQHRVEVIFVDAGQRRRIDSAGLAGDDVQIIKSHVDYFGIRKDRS